MDLCNKEVRDTASMHLKPIGRVPGLQTSLWAKLMAIKDKYN